MTESQTLLVEYVKRGSEAAFRELVERYLDLVFSTAVRLAGGDTHTAEDVAQTVFVDLARLAKSLSSDVRLGGWLHRHTCFVAAKTLRGERRRQFRERQAVEMNALTDHSQARLAEVAPILDEAINQLGATDRAAVLLRFYERLDFRSVGEALGTNEAAAQKRVSRALEKLHVLLKRRGVTLSVVALGAALSVEAVKAAPVGMAASISGMAVASAAAGSGNIFTLLRHMASTKLKTSVIAAVIVASVVTPLLLQRQAQARLREQDVTWRQQSDQVAHLTADNQRLTGLLAQANNSLPPSDNQFRELLRLRGEVGHLKDIVQKMTMAKTTAPTSAEDQIALLRQMYAARVERLKQWLEANPSKKIPELGHVNDDTWLGAVEQLDTEDDQSFARAAMSLRNNAQGQVLDQLWGGLRKYGAENGGQFPTGLAQLQPYLSSPIDDEVLQRYAIVPSSSLIPELQPGGDWVITETSAADPDLDMRGAIDMTNKRDADERITNRWNP
ncbi:MAG TPA: sigma-70 family RNA polymerase sigma factor [Verrucomicrobiae bacterium]|nr:sigma-70 family RNA polymerase sigma factor [Verrucomicrobiae bacterium]